MLDKVVDLGTGALTPTPDRNSVLVSFDFRDLLAKDGLRSCEEIFLGVLFSAAVSLILKSELSDAKG